MTQTNYNLYAHFQQQFERRGDKPALVLTGKPSISSVSALLNRPRNQAG